MHWRLVLSRRLVRSLGASRSLSEPPGRRRVTWHHNAHDLLRPTFKKKMRQTMPYIIFNMILDVSYLDWGVFSWFFFLDAVEPFQPQAVPLGTLLLQPALQEPKEDRMQVRQAEISATTCMVDRLIIIVGIPYTESLLYIYINPIPIILWLWSYGNHINYIYHNPIIDLSSPYSDGHLVGSNSWSSLWVYRIPSLLYIYKSYTYNPMVIILWLSYIYICILYIIIL